MLIWVARSETLKKSKDKSQISRVLGVSCCFVCLCASKCHTCRMSSRDFGLHILASQDMASFTSGVCTQSVVDRYAIPRSWPFTLQTCYRTDRTGGTFRLHKLVLRSFWKYLYVYIPNSSMLSGGMCWVSTMYRIWGGIDPYLLYFFISYFHSVDKSRTTSPHHVVTAAPRVQGCTEKQFRYDAAQGPHIYGLVEGKPQQDLWRPERGQTKFLLQQAQTNTVYLHIKPANVNKRVVQD